MEQSIFTVKENIPIARETWQLRLEGDCTGMKKPGQFAKLSLEGAFLRRPFSVTDWQADSLRICYRVIGKGTELMTGLKSGDSLDVLTALGNGFDTAKSGSKPLLVGGGLGASPMFSLCKALCAEGKMPQVILGFASAEDAVLVEEFRALGAEIYLVTEDGSLGERGYVTGIMEKLEYSFFYSCGPHAMYKAMERIARSGGEYSLEARMGCGFGACMGCSIQTASGTKRVCKDGPVFERSEIIW